ncbi:hypothetical protein AMATHDRAFT_136896 [Amanita thiersii Skay4041]|uniref:Uncharacterized protein n=1 Tax=Amanita thiersii Skay4041 TaxID=703135 RepID=A0A2A9P070_9AGAR|nr:hypothetical protein AMATHDRAFT_136896 [Amanita thiersii Skay4041]
MALSTTATAMYLLTKYSRSYPNSSQQHTDWQHFTNPMIRLALDVKKSDSSKLQSVRLRVLWSMNDNDNQSDVIFANIDLLSLSSIFADAQQKSIQGLPIKAVYRDNLVGFRYLHLRESFNTTSTYRRFQVTFTSASVALEFINSICIVCPCKANGTATTNSNLGTINNPTQMNRGLAHSQPLPPSYATSSCDKFVPATHTLDQLDIAGCTDRQKHDKVPSPYLGALSQAREHSHFASSPMDLSTSGAQSRPLQPYQGRTTSRMQVVSESLPQQTPIKLLDAHPPTISSQNPVNMESEVPISGEKYSDNASNSSGTRIDIELLSRVQEITQLYEISPQTLEQLVGIVVHEEGFVKLLESLASLWAIKGLVPFQPL